MAHRKPHARAGSILGTAAVAFSLLILPPILPPASQVAMAQDAMLLEEIIVTARKREENLLEIPESVTVLSADVIQRANINRLVDVGLRVPNLFMTERLDGFPNVSIRGLGGFGNTQGVGFYIDDVQLFSDASSRFGDLDRIEVLKGPQGTLYGGANIGGAVKYVAKRPDTEALEGNARLRVGEDSYYDIEGQVNIPLSDSWAMRAFGFYYTDDSYLKNPSSPRQNGLTSNNDEDIGEREEYGFRVTLAGAFTDQFSVYATARYNDLDAANNVWSVEPDGNLTFPDTIDFSFNPRHERETFAGSLELTYSFSSFDLISITSYTDTDSDRETDLDTNREFVLDLFRPQELQVFTQELRFSSTGEGPLQWQAGAYFLDYDRDLDSVLLARGSFCFLDPGVCDPLPVPPDETGVLATIPFEVSTRNRQQLAAFANFTYRWESWEFGAGLRVDEWESERTNLDSGLSGSQSETEIPFRASVAWYSNDERTMLYGTVSQGFEPGDFNLANFAGESSLFGYDAEEATQFEIGYKGRLLDDRMALTLAAFLIDYEDRQFELQAADPSGGFVEGIVNAGDSENWGFEGDLLWSLGEDWTLQLGFGFVDAEWDSGTISPVSGADIGGETPPNTADFSGVAALEYSSDLNADMRIFGRAQVSYTDDAATNAQFFDSPGDDFPAWDNDSFTVVDLNVGLEWKNWTFDVFVQNLFDEEYYVDAQEFPNFAGSARPGSPGAIVIGTLEQPRRVIVSARLDF
jgi:outer membrane receptor protein involved in Fe transport